MRTVGLKILDSRRWVVLTATCTTSRACSKSIQMELTSRCWINGSHNLASPNLGRGRKPSSDVPDRNDGVRAPCAP